MLVQPRDEEVDELGDGLEDLEVDVEFVMRNFQENLKAWKWELLLVSSLVLYKRLHTWTYR